MKTEYKAVLHSLLIALLTSAIPLCAFDKLQWKGALTDSAFSQVPKITLELLETGDTLQIDFNKVFQLTLPYDTLWNVCFVADSLERCYELVYTGTDSLFQAEITGRNFRVVETIASGVTAPELQLIDELDSSLFESEAPESFESDETVQLKKVILRVRRVPKRALGQSTVSAKLIKRMPGLAEADVIRSIQALPGVVASSDFSTKLYVRGGGADQNLFLLDNGVVYSPVHFFGLFSTFLVECLDEVDFYKGGFTPEYGNRLSSVIDLHSRKGGKDDEDTWFKNSSLKISTFAAQAHTEGHQGDFRWIAAGRATYIKTVVDVLRKLGVFDLDIDYKFYDFQGHLNYDPNDDHHLAFSFYKGKDVLSIPPFTMDWGNDVYPLNYEYRINDDWTSRATLAYSKFDQNFELKSIFGFVNDIEALTYKHVLEYTAIDNHRLTLGTETKKYQTTFIFDQPVVNVKFEDNADFWLMSFFLQDILQWKRFEFKLGARLNYNTNYKPLGLEPRLSAQYQLPANQFLDAHIGYYKQYINSILFGDFENLNEFYYPVGEYPTNTVEPASSILFSAGYRKEKLWGSNSLSVEAYYKTLNNQIVFAPNSLPDSIQESAELLGEFFVEGEGYSLGAEFSMRKEEGLWFGGVSYAAGYSVLKELDFIYHPDWHQPHSVKVDFAINWKGEDGIWKYKKKDRFLRSSSQIKWASGLPFTETIGWIPSHLKDQGDGNQSGGPNPIFNNNYSTPTGSRNGSFRPPYFRWDIKAIDIGKEGKWNFSWTILNVTNNVNIFFYFYDTSKNPPELTEIPQFPFLPVLLNFEYYF